MRGIEAYPLQWPAGWKRTPRFERERGAFDGTQDKIRRELLWEIDRIVLGTDRAKSWTVREYVVISSNVPLRKDGEMFASYREPDDPGVAVYFERDGKPLCLACDKYDAVWKNLRALQRTVEAMRGISRWGSSQLLDRAFTGFAALPAKSGPSCWETLGLEPGAREADILTAYREKAKQLHPDAGGSTEAFTDLCQAKDIALATVRSGRSAA